MKNPQVKRIYLASFLKNQTYFVPIFIIFFQDLGLSYSEIFWIFTIGSVFSFLIEIPTGLFADLYGKRKSIIFSKLTIFISFVAFGFAFNFWTLLAANLLYELGKSFRSGTETAYVYDYLGQNSETPAYTHVKANQKFYARISESIAAAIGGFLAVQLGFNMVFFIAAIPALINFIQTLFWSKIKEFEQSVSVKTSLTFANQAIKEVFKKKQVMNIVFNIMIFTSSLYALDKFVQPYMKNQDIDLEYFGLIYSGFLISVAFLVRYVSKLEEKFGGVRIMNFLTLIAFLPMLVLGLGWQSIFGVVLFFFVLMVENIRSPIANDVFHQNVDSKNRATMGSILELFKTSARLIILPVTGYLADFYSISLAILILSIVVLINGLFFYISKKA